MDAIGLEPQFIDHLAPVWRAMPDAIRGRFLTDVSLVDHAIARGLDPTPIDANRLRRGSEPPRANPGDGPAAFTVSIGDIKVARRLGYRRFAFMEHGAGQAYVGPRGTNGRHPSYAGGVDRDDVELFLCPNEYSAALWRAAYPSARVEVVGSPRLEDLPAREPGPGPVVAVSFHWPGSAAPEANTALSHYARSLPALAAAYELIGHAHPKNDWPERMKRIYRRAGIPFVADFEEVCRRADVYVCDNSSTLFEFAATGRPVVVLNAPSYRRNVIHGLRFWEAADVGIQVDQPGELIPAIAEALADPPARQDARDRALSIVYGRRTNTAEAAVQALEDWAASRDMVAA